MSLIQLPEEIQVDIKYKMNLNILDFNFISGGCINNGGRLQTSEGPFFIKWNDKNKYPGMFDAEAEGLKLMAQSNSVRVPKVIASKYADQFSFVLLEYLEAGIRRKDFWPSLGHELAKLHAYSSSYFGLDHDNYIGSLHQVNAKTSTWKEFFIDKRLVPQLKLAMDLGRITKDEFRNLEGKILNLEHLIPEEKPALIHGDMWGGNLIVGPNGEPCLIDPAVYFGHREMDIAMSKLFGGFDDYISAYEEIFPLEPGWNDRIDLWNLYPLLVHVNLFGGSYLSKVKQILKQF